MNLKNHKHVIHLFSGQIFFNNDGSQLLVLIFKPIYKTFSTFSGLSDRISEWESKEFSND